MIPIDEPADEIQLTEEQAGRIFGNGPRTAAVPPEPLTEEEGGTSLYELMVRKYGE